MSHCRRKALSIGTHVAVVLALIFSHVSCRADEIKRDHEPEPQKDHAVEPPKERGAETPKPRGTETQKPRGAEVKKDRAAEVVSSMLKAYGGVEAIGKVTTVTAKGHITEFLSGKSGSYARYFQRPRKLRIEVMPEQGGEIRILNGLQGWTASSQRFAEVSPLELQSMLYQYSYLNLPMAFADGTYHPEYGGKLKYDGGEAFVLLVQPKDAPRMGIIVDAKTRFIVRVDASFSMGPTGTGQLSTEYSDFRPVRGVMFPFKLTNFAGGLKISEIDLVAVNVDGKISPELFAIPRAGTSIKR